jgi:hypothetical protein
MSNIVLQPNASGTGNITIATPNTNTDRTLNIPDAAGDIVTTGDTGSVSGTMLAADSVDGAKISGNAFMTDLWFLTADATMSASSTRLGFDDGTSWTQATEASHSGFAYGTLGTNKMSVSSDVFTFPTTGVYRIDYNISCVADGADVAIRADINTTIDNTSFLDTAKTTLFHTAANQLLSGYCSYIFRCSNTSTHKVRFTLDSATGAKAEGGGLGTGGINPMATYVMFQRLGD